MEQYRLSRRAFLATAAAGSVAGCLGDSEYPHHDFDELVQDGLEQYEGDRLSTTAYVESVDEATYFYFPDPEGNEELIRPMSGTYELFKNPEPVPDEESLYVLDHHPEYALPASRDDGERTVKGRVEKIFFDEDTDESGYGLLYRF